VNSVEHYVRAWWLVQEVADAAADWDRPSPNPGWTARHVAGHLLDGHAQVSAMLRGDVAVVPTTDPRALARLAGADPGAALRAAAAEVRDQVRAIDPARVVGTPRGPAPVAQVLATAVVEPLLHGWDLAEATGRRLDLDPAITAAVLPAVEQLGGQLAATGMYAPALPVAADASPSERLLAATGRRARADQARRPR
jgi:uncharacterized protein (TIGR03086 family)